MKKKPKIKRTPKPKFSGFPMSNPQFGGGGKFFQHAGELAKNYGLALADSSLSAFGATDVIKPEQYSGYGATDMRNIGNITGSIHKMAAPIAATAIGGPQAGAAVSGIQQIGSQFNPADQSQQPIMRMGGSQPCYDCGGMHYAMGGVTQLPGGGYGDGTGQVENDENSVAPNGQFTQFNEPSHDQQNPNVPNASLAAGEKVFSAKLKMPGTKKSFAQLNKANNTNRQDKVLEDSKATSIAVNTAKLLKGIKAQNSDMLFAAQEQLKQDKVKAYAKRMGVELPDEQEQVHNPQEEQDEMMTAKYGGMQTLGYQDPRVTGGIDMTNPSSVQYHNEFGKYEMGGEMDQYKKGGRFMGINPAHKGYCTPMTKPTCTGHRRALALTLKKHHGFHEMGGVQKFDDGGLLSPEGYKSINQFENKSGTFDLAGNPVGMGKGDYFAQTGAGGTNPNAPKQIESYIDTNIGRDVWNKMPDNLRTQFYDAAFNDTGNIDYYARGLAQSIGNSDPNSPYYSMTGRDQRNGMPLNEAFNTIKGADYSNDNIYNNFVGIRGEQLDSVGKRSNFPASYMPTYSSRAKSIDANYIANQSKLAGQPPVGQPAVNPQATPSLLGQPNTGLNLGRTGNQLPYIMNGTNINYNTQNNVTPFNLDKSKDIKSSSMAGTTPPPSGRSNIPYGDMIAGAANLAGPIYGLATNKKPPLQDYMAPNVRYVDPSAALMDQDVAAKVAKADVKNATAGNSAAYLSNVGQTTAANAMNKYRVQSAYDQANAGIYNANQPLVADAYNKSIDKRDADLANYRNLNTKYVGDIGTGIASYNKQEKQAGVDQDYLDFIQREYPQVYAKYQQGKKTKKGK